MVCSNVGNNLFPFLFNYLIEIDSVNGVSMFRQADTILMLEGLIWSHIV